MTSPLITSRFPRSREFPPIVISLRHRAFTLIELLTVIAIIGILAAIIIPTVGEVRKSARASQAISNLRQLFATQMLYANDNKGQIAPTYGGVSTISWQTRLGPYLFPTALDGKADGPLVGLRINQATVFDVPEAKRAPGKGYKSVAVNWCLTYWWDNSESNRYRIDGWPAPSRLIIMGETNDDANNDVFGAPDKPKGSAIEYRRKGDKALMIFGDGHVKAMNKSELAYTNNPSGQNPWNWWDN